MNMKRYYQQYDCKYCHYLGGVLLELCMNCDQHGLIQNQQNLQSKILAKSQPKNIKKQHPIRSHSTTHFRKNQKQHTTQNSFSSFYIKDKSQIPQHNLQYQIQFQEALKKFQKKTNSVRQFDKSYLYCYAKGIQKIQNLPSSLEYLQQYQKPTNYYGFALPVINHRKQSIFQPNSVWIRAYYQTTIQNVLQILSHGFKQQDSRFLKEQNINPLNHLKQVGTGIVSNSHVKSIWYQPTCVLQCKVYLPETRIPKNYPGMFVTSSRNIVAYRLLLKKS